MPITAELQNVQTLEDAEVDRKQAIAIATVIESSHVAAQNDLKSFFIEEMDKRDAKMDARFEKIDARFEKIDARFEKIDARFDMIQKEMDTRFDMMQKEMDTRFDMMQKEMDTRFNMIQKEMDIRFEQVEERFTSFGNTLYVRIIGTTFMMLSLAVATILGMMKYV